MKDDEIELIMRCNHCRNKTIFKIEGQYTTEKIEPSNIRDIKTWQLMQCKTCSQPTLKQLHQKVEVQPQRYGRQRRDIFGTDEKEKIYEDDQTTILYPINPITPEPSEDMPVEIAKDYNEARAIFGSSPRGSAALLRLAIQKLCIELGESGKNINNDIAELVKKGLPVEVRQSLDIVRVIGNEAVHPGKLDLHDDQDTVLILFELVNFIIREMITRPREIKEIYNKLPETKREGIEQRDQAAK